MVSAGLYTLLIDLRSLLKESSFPLIRALISNALAFTNTIREAVDDTDTDIEDPLFVFKRAQTPPLST
jgi:hypothetical protein